MGDDHDNVHEWWAVERPPPHVSCVSTDLMRAGLVLLALIMVVLAIIVALASKVLSGGHLIGAPLLAVAGVFCFYHATRENEK